MRLDGSMAHGKPFLSNFRDKPVILAQWQKVGRALRRPASLQSTARGAPGPPKCILSLREPAHGLPAQPGVEPLDAFRLEERPKARTFGGHMKNFFTSMLGALVALIIFT